MNVLLFLPTRQSSVNKTTGDIMTFRHTDVRMTITKNNVITASRRDVLLMYSCVIGELSHLKLLLPLSKNNFHDSGTDKASSISYSSVTLNLTFIRAGCHASPECAVMQTALDRTGQGRAQFHRLTVRSATSTRNRLRTWYRIHLVFTWYLPSSHPPLYYGRWLELTCDVEILNIWESFQRSIATGIAMIVPRSIKRKPL